MDYKVSIVIIGRNEERDIGRCLDAAQAAADQIGGAEIIFVDSASTDNTVSIVQSYGVRVLQMKPDWKLSPSAGRFVGSHYAHGEFILFIDADTLVYKDFLPAAIGHFENNPELGGINGFIDDLDEKGEFVANFEERYEAVADIQWLRGPCCFYRKKALQEAGTFNPHLAVEEEAELGLRLIKNGWKLQIIPVPMACHTRCFHMQTFQSLFAIIKRDIITKRFGAFTNTTAYAFKEGNGLAFCWLRMKTMIVFLVWLLLSPLCLILPEFFNPKVIFPLSFALGLLFIYRKKRSIYQTALFITNKALTFIDLLAGLHKISLKDRTFYPLDVIEHKAEFSAVHINEFSFTSRNIKKLKCTNKTKLICS